MMNIRSAINTTTKIRTGLDKQASALVYTDVDRAKKLWAASDAVTAAITAMLKAEEAIELANRQPTGLTEEMLNDF